MLFGLYICIVKKETSGCNVLIVGMIINIMFCFFDVRVSYDDQHVEWGWYKEHTCIEIVKEEALYYTLSRPRR